MGKATRRKQKVTLRQSERAEPQVVIIGYDGSPPIFREARDLGGIGSRKKVLGPQNINVDRLEWLLAHNLIEVHQHTAGRKLQESWQMADLSVGAKLEGGGGGGSSTGLSDAKCDAFSSVGKAVKSLSPKCWRMIQLVVIEGVTVQKAAAQMRIPERGALPALVFSLDQLGHHYGLC
jgi:hypothetical protein